MSEKLPEEFLPYSDQRAALLFADVFEQAGLPGDIEKRLTHVIPGRTMSRQDRIDLGGYFAQVFQDWQRAEETLLPLLEENPDDVEVYSWLLYTYQWSRQYDKAIRLLEGWIVRHPTDSYAKKALENIKQKASLDTLNRPEIN
jgi:tetratricopeptide (TPR) repeat protein